MITLHIVSHTHWDREWYRTFQEFRFRMVGLIDQLLDLLEQDPAYRLFMLDGQTILMEDYLVIRPAQEPRIQRLIAQGRLLIGPWYVLPDEFLEGPEALIRNLLFGREVCRRFTAEAQPIESVAYLPDSFGHIGQLPQIVAGFGLDAVCVWRGVGDMPTEFRWAAPDGTERLVLHLRDSYSNGAWLASEPEDFARDLGAARDGLAMHATTSHLLIMHGTDHMEVRPDLPVCIGLSEEKLGDRVIHSSLPDYLSAVRSELGTAGIAALPRVRGELRSSQRAHLLPAVLSTRLWIKQRNARCEDVLTRWAEPFSALAEQITGIMAHRGFLHEAWAWLLQNHPHDSICGCSVDQVHREMRTRFDWCEQIAENVAQASLEAIAREVGSRHSIDACPASDDGARPGTALTSGKTRIVVFNPGAGIRTDRVRVHLASTPAGAWSIVDAGERLAPHRVLARCTREYGNEFMDRERLAALLARIAAPGAVDAGHFTSERLETHVEDGICFLEVLVAVGRSTSGRAPVPPEQLSQLSTLLSDDTIRSFHVHVVEDDGLDIEFLARDVPGLGFTQFMLTDSNDPVGAGKRPTARPPMPPSIENEFFVVEANTSDGTLTITDRSTGLVLAGANRFVDGGDRGDEYTYCPPEQDIVVVRPAAPPSVQRVDDGLGQSLEVSLEYRVPRSLAPGDRSARSTDSVCLPIRSRCTLTPGLRRIEFETTVTNCAEDHRLRVLFPTLVETDRSWAESHFDVVERPISPQVDAQGWSEQPVATHPQLRFVDVADGRRGVALANRGLPEFEVMPGNQDTAGVTLALTLLRCVGWLSRADLSTRSGHAGPGLRVPEAQCAGEHTFRYALIPHSGNYLTAQREAHAFNTGLRAVCVSGHTGSLPASGSLLAVEPAAVVLSVVKPPQQGEGMVVRLYNSAAAPVEARVKLWCAFQEALLVSMDESRVVARLADDSDEVSLPLRPRQIATMLFRFRSAQPGEAVTDERSEVPLEAGLRSDKSA